MNLQRSTTVAAGIAGTGFSAALVVVLSWTLGLCGVSMPPEVAVAVGTVLATGIHWVFGGDPAEATTAAADAAAPPTEP
jgi:hypothetical protein